jgi:hypothetical protein
LEDDASEEDASEEDALEADASEEPVLAELLDGLFEELLSEEPLAAVVVFCAAADVPVVVVERLPGLAVLAAAFLLEAVRAGS